MASYTPRPPLLPWSPTTWSDRWSAQGRLSSTPVPRTPFLLLKAPVSTLYEEKFGGDRNMFTVGMYCSRMMARSIRVGLVIDCTTLDIEEFEPLPIPKTTSARAAPASKFDKRVRYFHNPSEWDDYDVEYHRLLPPIKVEEGLPLAPQVLAEFYKVVSNFLQKSRSSGGSNNNSNSKTCISLFDARGGLGAASYLAAAYMCHALRAPPHAAFAALKEGTPAQTGEDADVKWGMCDVRLVKDLQTRFKGRKEIRMEGRTPKWWWAVDEEEEEDEEEEAERDAEVKEGDENDKTSKKKKRAREETITIPPCDSSSEDDHRAKRPRAGDASASLHPILPKEMLEPVPKDSPRWSRALTVLSQMTNTPSKQSPNPTAITTLPLKPETDVSAGNSDANLLQFIQTNSDKYKVTWLSTKGRRGLLLILTEAVYFLEQPSSSSSSSSQNISISIVTNIKFPTPKDRSQTQHRTLLDVILVTDTEQRNNKPTHRFYALDILCIEGGMVWHKPWDQRWRFLNEGVLMQRKKDEASSQQSRHVYAKEPIKIRAKEFFPMTKMGFVMKDVCAGVAHASEGVRVVPMGPYGIGGETKDAVSAVVWRRGNGLEEEKLKSLILGS